MGYSSQAGQFVIRQQTGGYGVPAADLGTKGIAIRLRSGSMSANRELLIPDAEIGGGRDVADAYLGAVSWSGDYDFYLRADSFATLLHGVLGIAEAPDTTVTGVAKHVIRPSDAAQLPFFSIEERIGDGLESFRYQDAVINTLHVEAEANGYVTGTVGLIGARQTAGVTLATGVDWDDTPMYVGTNVNVTFGGIGLPAKSFSLDINNNFEDDDFRLGSFYLGDLTPKRREITASFSLRHIDSSQWRQATYGAAAATVPGGQTVKSALEISIDSYENIPTTAVKYGVELSIDQFVLTPFSFEASGDDILENDVEGQALRPIQANDIMVATVTTGKTELA